MQASISSICINLVKILLVTLVLCPKLVDGRRKKFRFKTTIYPISPEPAAYEEAKIQNESPPHLFWRELLERELDEMEDTYAGEPPVHDDVGERTIAILDSKFEVICSGSAIAPDWALTASHCLVTIPKYIKSAISNKIVPVQEVFKHPKYNYDVALRKTQEGGTDIVGLDHDIGLVRTKRQMHLPMMMPGFDSLMREIDEVDPQRLQGHTLIVYGFGRHDTEDTKEDDDEKKMEANAGRGIASSLFKSKLQAVKCAREEWYPCVCGAAAKAGVCAGDSGGPVFSGHVQIGITSLGPLKCGAGNTTDQGQTVITAIRPYLRLINRTVYGGQRFTGSLDPYYYKAAAVVPRNVAERPDCLMLVFFLSIELLL